MGGRKIDGNSRAKRGGRAGVVRPAVRLDDEAKRRQAADDGIRESYRGEAADLLGEVEDLLDSQTWPKR